MNLLKNKKLLILLIVVLLIIILAIFGVTKVLNNQEKKLSIKETQKNEQKENNSEVQDDTLEIGSLSDDILLEECRKDKDKNKKTFKVDCCFVEEYIYLGKRNNIRMNNESIVMINFNDFADKQKIIELLNKYEAKVCSCTSYLNFFSFIIPSGKVGRVEDELNENPIVDSAKISESIGLN